LTASEGISYGKEVMIQGEETARLIGRECVEQNSWGLGHQGNGLFQHSTSTALAVAEMDRARKTLGRHANQTHSRRGCLIQVMHSDHGGEWPTYKFLEGQVAQW
jgi:hypothetical protein